jgi:hypothetical protein
MTRLQTFIDDAGLVAAVEIAIAARSASAVGLDDLRC